MKFIKTKGEVVGNHSNWMDLHFIEGELNVKDVSALCRKKRNAFTIGMFLVIVFFDSEENAVFPKTPFTALYGAEEEPRKHIKVIYCYNRVNGYSALQVFEKNAWESVAVEYKI